MSDGNGNKTVFRPSPLQGLRQGQAGAGGQAVPPPAGGAPGFDAPPAMARGPALAPSPVAPPVAPRRDDDDVPQPATAPVMRNRLLDGAAPLLALAAAMRAGRTRLPLPTFHREATAAIAAFDRTIQPQVSEETRQRAKYALCATVDDIAQNLPNLGTDGAEWARRSLVIAFFQENIGGDRFWQLAEDMLRAPQQNGDMIELFHACLAAGFEGRFRIMPDGQRRLHEIMSRLHGAIDHVRGLSPVEMSPGWRGQAAPLAKVGFWTYVAAVGAGALALLLLVFVALRLMLMTGGEAPAGALAAINPDGPLRLSRAGAPPPAPAPAAQAQSLRTFLAPEIAAHEVTVDEDATTVRVRTTTGTLFRSGSDELEPGREALFRRIGKAVDSQPGAVTVEGHADSDQVHTLTFPDNMALSQARADKVAGLVRAELKDGSRVSAKGMGDTVPLAGNDSPEGKAKNRRVEVIVPRHE